MKPNGISVLMASQNSAQTVALSVRSFLPFADEIIAVDNGSTDGTIEILQRLSEDYPEVTFINAPHVHHLNENRQIAYENSRYRWIFRGDTDFIAWTSGVRDIRRIRKLILDYPQTDPPVGFEFDANYVVRDWYHTLPGLEVAFVGRRVYQDVPGMEFCRINPLEVVRLPGRTDGQGWKRIRLPNVHLMHADIRPPMPRYLRRYRRAWREQGDFERFPTVESYLQHQLCTKNLLPYATEWAARYDRQLVPYLGDYPEIVRPCL